MSNFGIHGGVGVGVQVEKLLELMDPCNTGDISFIMFCRGVETFLMGELM